MITEEKQLLTLRQESVDEDFIVEYDILPAYNSEEFKDAKRKEIAEAIAALDEKSDELNAKIANLNIDIDRLTNHADGLDYTIAVASGVLCGLIDSFVVGEFNYDEALKKSKENINNYVEQKAEKLRNKETVEKAIENAKKKATEKGEKLSASDIKDLKDKISNGLENKYDKIKAFDAENGTSKALQRAIKKLEEVYKIPSDNLFSGAGIGVDATTHHLDDLAHHPTVLGLVAAVAGTLFRAGIFTNKDGKWSVKFAKPDMKEMLQMWVPIVISGVLTWLVFNVKSKYKSEIDEKLPKPIQKLLVALAEVPAAITILSIANNWLGHLVSDMAGSSTSAGKGRDGMGIPGLFISMFKEISSIPPLNLTPLPGVVNEIFSNERFDMRHELALLSELGRQAIPVILGDIMVRTFYFVRHLVSELKVHKDLKLVNWRNVIPFNNRTIARMITIESGTFTAIDLADAAIRSAIEAGPPITPAFWSKFILKVNFVGIGRFVIAVGTDVGMGIKRQKLIKERMQYNAENNMLQVCKLYYLQEDMWIEVVDTEKAINDMCSTAEKSMIYFAESWNDISMRLNNIRKIDINKIEDKNPGLVDDILDILEWG